MMKKYTLIISFIVTLISLLLVKRYVLYYHHKTTAMMYSSLEYFEKNSKYMPKKYLIVGDGAIMTALNPMILGEQNYSQAMTANSLMDTYYLLKRSDLSKIHNGIIISNSFFYERNYETDFWKVIIPVSYYKFNELAEIYKISKENKIFPFVRFNEFTFWLKVIQYKYFFSPDDIELFNSKENFFNKSESYKILTDERLSKFNGFAFIALSKKPARFFYSYHLHFNKYFFVNPTDDFYLKKILVLLKNKKVYFVKTPLAKIAHPSINVDKFEMGLSNYMQTLKREFPNLQYINNDHDLTKDDFYNFYNLNFEGSKKFSNNLKQFLH